MCNDMAYVREFMLRPEIYRYAAEYGNDPDAAEFVSDEKQCWLDFEGVGLINIHIETGCMIQFHPYILRTHKERFNEMVLKLFHYFDKCLPEEVVKINVTIPVIYENTLRAAETVGMTSEGLDRSSYRHKGGVCDRILYGITREELECQN